MSYLWFEEKFKNYQVQVSKNPQRQFIIGY